MRDPTRNQRAEVMKAMLSGVALARKDALDRIRRELIAGNGLQNLADLQPGIDNLNSAMSLRLAKLLDSAIGNTYKSSILRTIAEIDRTPKPPGTGRIEFALDFTRPDQIAIDNITALGRTDLTGMSSELTRQVMHAIARADKQGLGVNKIAEIVHGTYREIAVPRAKVIVRTTLNNAHNHAAFDRIRRYATHKQWIATVGGASGERTRNSHKQMHKVVVEVEDYFEVPAYKPTPRSKTVPACQLLFPGDVSTDPPAGQTIACRCTLAPKFGPL